MRTMYILRGAPASGKSSWVKNNGLEQYTLSSDGIRLLYQSPVLNTEGKFIITQQNDKKVWEMLMTMLEDRMKRGEFVIIDGTHYKSELLNRYKQLIAKYRYRAYVVDFTDVPKEELLSRNANRDEYKRVPEAAITKMCAVFEQDKEVSNRFNILTREEAILKLSEPLLFDFNEYNKVVFFGDIHGCYEPIQKYFEANPVDESNFYIFLGDYIDRGIQNKEVLEFCIKYSTMKNFLFLEGNHEGSLRKYADDEGLEEPITSEERSVIRKYFGKGAIWDLENNRIRSTAFKNNTIPQIEDIPKKDLRQFCRKLGQMAFFNFGGKKYFACHGGIPDTPSIFISTNEMIKGVGKYEDTEAIYKAWLDNTSDNFVLIHGHRNIFDVPTKVNDRCYNLNAVVEKGEPLRVLEVTKDSESVILIPNTTFDRTCERLEEKFDIMETKTDNYILKELNESKLIQKKIIEGGIVSYNFKRDVFKRGKWDSATCKARGLFVDIKTEKVIARSYNKFFNLGEMENTSLSSLKKNLVFPMVGYKKENGFLAMVSYNWNTDDFLICSKSTNQGDFADMIREELYTPGKYDLELMKNYLIDSSSTMVFECINQEKDPHIIKYDEDNLILLDVIKNSFEYSKLDYNLLKGVAKAMRFKVKELDLTFNDWDTFYRVYKEQENSMIPRHEGWVFEDSNGFMFKYKTQYYKFWKYMRGIKEKLQQGNNVKKIFRNELEVRVFNFLKTFSEEELKNLSMIEIEDEFYTEVGE